MGLIKNDTKVSRSLDFEGLKRAEGMSKNSVYASDIDAIMEFNNKFLIIVEAKEEGLDLSLGQEIMLRNIAKSWTDSGHVQGINKKALVIFVTHSPEGDGPVPIKECMVKSISIGGDFMERNGNLLEFLWDVAEKWDIDKLKEEW